MATQAERSLHASIAAHISWANCEDRTARTSRARAALEDRFLAEAHGDPIRAEHLRKAHYKKLALKSAQARRKAAGLIEEADAADAELSADGGDAA